MRRDQLSDTLRRQLTQQVAAARVSGASSASIAKREAAQALLDPDFVIIGGGLEAVEDGDGVVVIGMVGGAGGGGGALDGGAPDRVLGGTAGINAGLPGDR